MTKDEAPTYFTDKHAQSMTLRDHFAGLAMQAFMTREAKFSSDLMMYAGAAYDVADAMLEARKT